MVIITKHYQVFKFNELSKKAKEFAIEKWYENEDYPFLTEDIKEELDYKDSYFSDIKLQYSLSCCQGDGLSFSGEFDLKKWLNDKHKISEWKKNIICDYYDNITSSGNNGHYCYASKNDIDYRGYPNLKNECKRIEKLISEILNKVEDYYINLCKELEKYGYSVIEYRMDFDEFDDHCESNEYNFFEGGRMANL